MYMTVSLTYWLSTKNIDLGVSKDVGKNFITFTFVPINSMLVLPFLAGSYKYLKESKLSTQKFRNRVILATVILVIALIVEFFYFKDIQNGILSIIQSAK